MVMDMNVDGGRQSGGDDAFVKSGGSWVAAGRQQLDRRPPAALIERHVKVSVQIKCHRLPATH